MAASPRVDKVRLPAFVGGEEGGGGGDDGDLVAFDDEFVQGMNEELEALEQQQQGSAGVLPVGLGRSRLGLSGGTYRGQSSGTVLSL